jgi:hypothetical protein
MKYVLPILALVALFAGQAMAGDGNVSQDMLAKMGLSGMQTMSDTQGSAVRGMGFCGCATLSVTSKLLVIAPKTFICENVSYDSTGKVLTASTSAKVFIISCGTVVSVSATTSACAIAGK